MSMESYIRMMDESMRLDDQIHEIQEKINANRAFSRGVCSDLEKRIYEMEMERFGLEFRKKMLDKEMWREFLKDRDC